MKNFLAVLLAVLPVVCLTAVAQAGGGTKNNAQIKVVNDASNDETLVAFLNSGTNGNATVLGLSAGTTIDANVQTQFNNLHGHTITPGSSFTFTALAAGDYSLTTEFLGNSGTTTGAAGITTVHVNKGQTVTVTFTGSDTVEPSATVSPSSAAR